MGKYLTTTKITRNGVSQAGRISIGPELMDLMSVGLGDTLGIRKEGERFVVEKVVPHEL